MKIKFLGVSCAACYGVLGVLLLIVAVTGCNVGEHRSKLEGPSVEEVTVESSLAVLITFTSVMAATETYNVYAPENYEISGDGKGTFNTNPDAVEWLGPEENDPTIPTYRLLWSCPDIMLHGEDVTITVVGSMADTEERLLQDPKSGTHIGGGVGRPDITLLGDNPQIIECGAGYDEAGATARDVCDNNLTEDIMIDDSDVDAGTVGTYTVTYNVNDALGNAAVEVTRTVQVQDTTAPDITLIGDAVIDLECGVSTWSEPGAEAWDDCDGDISPSIEIDSSEVNTDVVGTYTVYYNVTDGADNPAEQVTRTVNVNDTTAPVITLISGAVIDLECGVDTWSEPGAEAWDDCDGNLTDNIVIDGDEVDVDVVGAYTITYNVTDAEGNAAEQVTRTVNVQDTTAPVITRLDNAVVIIECGDEYNDAGAEAWDDCDGELTDNIEVGGDEVDTNTAGSYIITYNVTDAEGNAAVEVTRRVDVEDTTRPVITLLGNNFVAVACGDEYTDAGAEAWDDCDGDITDDITTTYEYREDTAAPWQAAGGIDVFETGEYRISYQVSDNAGNDATTIRRTVIVVDDQKPVITLVGDDVITLECGVESYEEQGATAWDDCDGELTEDILVGGDTVDTDVVGTYTITYTVTDGADNTAEETRTVEVRDTTPPLISLLGEAEVVVPLDGAYTDAGAEAWDDCDGDLTDDIDVGGDIVDTSSVGTYVITYNVTDAEDNAADEVTRTVEVIDTVEPFLVSATVTGVKEVTVVFSKDMNEADATNAANYTISGDGAGTLPDNPDGVAGSGTTYVLIWNCPALMRNDATVTITVDADVEDTVGNSMTAPLSRSHTEGGQEMMPGITLAGDNPAIVECGSDYTDSGATAMDGCGNDIDAADIAIDDSAVDTGTVGLYTVTITATDAAGNVSQTTRDVDVQDTEAPVITLNGDAVVDLECGVDTWSDPGATADDTCEGALSVVTGGDTVDVNTVGEYVITYNVTDASGNVADEVTRTVNVNDTTAPVIVLQGDDPQVIEIDEPYVELGATATDDCDGNLTDEIDIDDSDVDTGTVGTYTVTYNVADAEGNAAAEVTRTVQVMDTEEPYLVSATVTGVKEVTVVFSKDMNEAHAANAANYTISGDGAGTLPDNPDGVAGSGTTYVLTWNCPGLMRHGATVTITVNADMEDTVGNSMTAPLSRTHTNGGQEVSPDITLLGDDPAVVECGDAYTDDGATATDGCGNDIDAADIDIDDTDVDTAVIGDYTVFITVTDAAGNVSETTRSVAVQDATAPVIALIGDADIDLECNVETWSEPGAEAWDDCDGDLTDDILIAGDDVDTSTVGEYVITYNVTDSEGNAADEVIRTVNVVDTAPPVIMLVGDPVVVIECGEDYEELGATADDVCDGDLTEEIEIDDSDVDTGAVGIYTIRYTVTDGGDNTTEETRTVEVIDTTPPVITLVGDAEIIIDVNAGDPYEDDGATADDVCEGNLSDDIIVGGATVDVNAIGTYVITYDVDDSEGNSAEQVIRTVYVVDPEQPYVSSVEVTGIKEVTVTFSRDMNEVYATDEMNYTISGEGAGTLPANPDSVAGSGATYVLTWNCPALMRDGGTVMVAVDETLEDSVGNTMTAPFQLSHTGGAQEAPPVVTLLGETPQFIECGHEYVELYAEAVDGCDIEIDAATIDIDASEVETNETGVYAVTYAASDEVGNMTVETRTVEVVDSIAPVITLTGAASQVIECGDEYTELGATADDLCEGDLTDAVVIDASDVDTSAVGVYTVTYNVIDASGNAADEVTRTVNVVDTTPPVITLVGDMYVAFECGDEYTELGATADDVCEGDLTDEIDIDDSDVDTGTVGNYTVTYTVTDSAGNVADTVIRTVFIRDNEPPVVTLVGAAEVELECGVDTWEDPGAEAEDLCEGVLSNGEILHAYRPFGQEVFEPVEAVDESVPGRYRITYRFTDGEGNVGEARRRITVRDETPPVITLLGDAVIDLECGVDTWDDPGAEAQDLCEGDISGDIVVGGDTVDVNTVGVYIITYNVTDAAGNAAAAVTRTVNVEDTTAPVLDLSVETFEALVLSGDLYVDMPDEFTAMDACDGDLTEDVEAFDIEGRLPLDDLLAGIRVATMNEGIERRYVSRPGQYGVRYEVHDGAGNPAEIEYTLDVPEYHPADVLVDDDADFRIVMREAIGYISGWQRDENLMDYAMRAAYLWQRGEEYVYVPDGPECPECWELAHLVDDASHTKSKALVPDMGVAIATYTAVDNGATIHIEPSTGTTVWGMEAYLPQGVIPYAVNGANASWHGESGKLTWWAANDAPATLGFQARGPEGVHELAVRVSFDGIAGMVIGDTLLVLADGSTKSLPRAAPSAEGGKNRAAEVMLYDDEHGWRPASVADVDEVARRDGDVPDAVTVEDTAAAEQEAVDTKDDAPPRCGVGIMDSVVRTLRGLLRDWLVMGAALMVLAVWHVGLKKQ